MKRLVKRTGLGAAHYELAIMRMTVFIIIRAGKNSIAILLPPILISIVLPKR